MKLLIPKPEKLNENIGGGQSHTFLIKLKKKIYNYLFIQV